MARYFLQFLFFSCLLLPPLISVAKLPSGLTAKDQEIAGNILTTGSTTKMLSSPIPLGGFNGFEVGLSVERISMEEISRLGNGGGQGGEFAYYNLSIGKGLYYDIDVFFSFSPLPQDNQINNYGALARLAFFRPKFTPFSLTLTGAVGSANFSNLIGTVHQSINILANIQVENISVYMGGGSVRGVATFIGGASGITNDGESSSVNVRDTHSLFGINFDFMDSFIALQMDRYQESTISAKIGTRF